MAASFDGLFSTGFCGRKVFEPEPYDKTEIGGLASAAHVLETSETWNLVTEVPQGTSLDWLWVNLSSSSIFLCVTFSDRRCW
jgi:hypothetical protein